MVISAVMEVASFPRTSKKRWTKSIMAIKPLPNPPNSSPNFEKSVKTIKVGRLHLPLPKLAEECEKDSAWAKFARTGSDGKTYYVDYYNLDVIISVGYRVKSSNGIVLESGPTMYSESIY